MLRKSGFHLSKCGSTLIGVRQQQRQFLLGDPKVTTPSGKARTPITQKHVRNLTQYADAIENSSLKNWSGLNVIPNHLKSVRELASRISKYSAEGLGSFSKADVDMLTKIGNELVRTSSVIVADPKSTEQAKLDAQSRLGWGNGVNETRDAIRNHVI